jgi:hypothetical protein
MSRTGLLVLSLLVSALKSSDAQSPRAVAVAFRPANAATVVMDSITPLQDRPGGRKEPVLAGAISWIIPGLGSIYANHNTHGFRHMAVAGASIAVMILGVSDCFDDSYVDECDTGLGFAVIGYLAYVVNNVWAIVSGFNDALANNRARQGPVVAPPARN